MVALCALLLAQQGGPWNNDLKMRISDGGKPFGEETTFVRAAGVPSLTRDRKGRLIAAFQWFPQDRQEAWDRVATSISEDNGKTWSAPKPIVVDGLPNGYQRPFDPTLVVTGTGNIRIYFTSSKPGQMGPNGVTGIYSAVSSDGVNFKFEPGARLAVMDRRVIDCAVHKLGDTWHMIAPIGRPEDGAYHATSKDGLEFTRTENIKSEDGANWTGNLVAASPGMCFYGSSNRGLWWSYSAEGKSWTRPTFLNVMGGDPAVVNGADGRVIMIYVGPREPK